MALTNVLYIDRAERARAQAAEFFSAKKRYHLDTAQDYKDALKYIKKTNHDLMILEYADLSSAFVVQFTHKRGGLYAVVLSDSERIRSSLQSSGIANAPKTPLSKNLEIITGAYENGTLRKIGLQ